MKRRAFLLAAALGAVVGACVDRANPEHCANADGDATCAERHPDGTLPYCELGACAPEASDGCVAEPPTDECAAPCGELGTGGDDCVAGTDTSTTITTSADTTSTSTSPTTTADTSTSASESTSTGPACIDDAGCGGATPFCRDSLCVPCSGTDDPEAACTGLDPDAPLCFEDACVQCTADELGICSGTVPICDTRTNTCVGCTRHEECPASACHFVDGSCLPEDRVWYVDGDATGCGSATGTMAAPYCTIGDAVAEISQASRGTIRVLPASEPYSEAVAIASNRIVALMSAEPGLPELTASGTPILTVEDATVYVQRLRLQSSASAPAVALDGSTVWIDRSEIVLNQGGGIDAVGGAELHVRGSVVGAGGTGLADRQAIDIAGSTFEIVGSTIAGNDGSGFASLRCTDGGGGTIRASIVVGLDPPSISCAGADVSGSAIDSDLPGGNLALDMFDADWFLDPAAGDFHLATGTPFEDIGVWQSGDLELDLDGDPRGGRDGAVDFAGADVIP